MSLRGSSIKVNKDDLIQRSALVFYIVCGNKVGLYLSNYKLNTKFVKLIRMFSALSENF